MGRHSCCYKHKLRKGLWSPEEDEKLIKHITSHGYGSWSSVPKLAGLQRCGKSCRLRWINYLRPDLKRGTFSQEEENLIIKLHAVLGNRWSQIATQLPGRTDNEIKNLWNSSIKKKLRQRGMDPNTHKPLSEVGNDQEKSKTDDKTSSVLSSADAENSDNHGLAAAEKPKPSNSAPVERNPLLENSSNHLTAAHSYSTQELFLNRFVASYESSTSWKPSDLTGFPSFHQLNYGLSMNPNTSISDHFSIDNTIASTANLPSMASPSLSAPTRLKPSGNFLSDNSIGSLNVRFESWDSCTLSNNSRTSNVSSTSGELQSNCSLFGSDAFPWTAAGCGKAEKEAHIPSPDGEDIKWAEYLQTPFLMGNSIHSHNPTGQDHNLYGETKSQAQFGADGSLDPGNWHPNQQQQQQSLQATKIYSKRFQRLPVATFGQFS